MVPDGFREVSEGLRGVSEGLSVLSDAPNGPQRGPEGVRTIREGLKGVTEALRRSNGLLLGCKKNLENSKKLVIFFIRKYFLKY